MLKGNEMCTPGRAYAGCSSLFPWLWARSRQYH